VELLSFGDGGWGDEMARGALMTVAISLSSFFLGLVIGIGGSALKLSRNVVNRAAGDAYTTIVRGIPELLILYLLFFGGGGAVMYVARMFGYDGYIELHAFTVGTVAIGVVSGAYSTEVIRGAVLAVPKGQVEAAKAVGMNRWLLFRRIMLPQVMRFALPGLGNVWQLTLKDTALISVTGLVEIMRQAQIGSGSTQKPFTFYLVAAILYLLLTAFSNRGFGLAEAWANRGVRRA
jgi:octopine/nopaline transport system permease protein